MNGRIYDPLLGRFLSADLEVQFPSSLQSYNRYSYVRNNPLTLVDPTGWFEYKLFGLTLTNEGDTVGGRIVSALKTGDWSGVKEGSRSAAQIQAKGVGEALRQTADNIVTQGPIVALELGPVPSPSAAGPLLQSVTGETAVVAAESVTVESAVISGTVAVANKMAGGDIKPGDGTKVDQKPANADTSKGTGDWKGKPDYSSIRDPKNVDASTKPTPRQVREMKETNKAHNDGVLRDDKTGEVMVDSAKSQKGVTPPTNEAQVDHIKSVNQGGTRTQRNLELRTRANNRAKSDKTPDEDNP